MTHARTHHARRILVLEDEPSILASLKKFFSDDGYHVDGAGELEEAEALIATRHYELVIADLRLSNSNLAEGLGILRFVRQQSRGTRVVILTAYATADVRRSARALGADALLCKPVPLVEIASTVRHLTGAQL